MIENLNRNKYLEVANAFKTSNKMNIVKNKNRNRLKRARNGNEIVTTSAEQNNSNFSFTSTEQINSGFSIEPKHFISSGTADFSSPLEQYQRVSEIRKQQGLPPLNADEKRLLMLQLRYQQQSQLEDKKSTLRQGEGLRQDVFKAIRATLPIFYGK